MRFFFEDTRLSALLFDSRFAVDGKVCEGKMEEASGLFFGAFTVCSSSFLGHSRKVEESRDCGAKNVSSVLPIGFFRADYSKVSCRKLLTFSQSCRLCVIRQRARAHLPAQCAFCSQTHVVCGKILILKGRKKVKPVYQKTLPPTDRPIFCVLQCVVCCAQGNPTTFCLSLSVSSSCPADLCAGESCFLHQLPIHD